MRRAAIAAVLALASACGGNAPSGPPEIRLGVDVCDGCGMAISDVRYAAAAEGEIEGELRVLKFDDIGCLARWEARSSRSVVRHRWVHDRDGEHWLDADAAIFERSTAWATPMGSGLAAFSKVPGPGAGVESLRWERVLDLARRGALDAPVSAPSPKEPR